MKKNILNSLLIAFAIFGLSSCDQEDGKFDNHVFLNIVDKTSDVLLVGDDTYSQSFQINMLRPLERDVNCNIQVNEAKVNDYNVAYNTEALLLAPSYYTIETTQTTINAGTMVSVPINVSFKNLTDLDRDLIYVLPVMMTSDERVLESKSTIYYVVKAGALINVVANINNNYVYVDWKDASDLRSLSTFTAEILVNPKNFAPGHISSVMGIEGKFLLRFGDSEPENQLQIATSNGNYSSANLVAETGKWTHIAMTYDATAKKIEVYFNGILKETFDTNDIGNVDWGVPYSDESNGQPRCFRIGYSYDGGRDFDGSVSECRVWNRVLTSSEINGADHFYNVDPTSEGLIAYWKFKDGGGTKIKDYSAKGNDATAASDLQWVKVQLPNAVN